MLPDDFNSSPCMQHEDNTEYAGKCGNKELADFLSSLLEAERAGAKICVTSLQQQGLGKFEPLLHTIRQDEVKSCQALISSLDVLGVEPHKNTGDFYEKCMAITDLTERMEFLNRGQNWVVRKINEILPRVAQPQIFQQLKTMRDEHEQNIALTDRYLKNV